MSTHEWRYNKAKDITACLLAGGWIKKGDKDKVRGTVQLCLEEEQHYKGDVDRILKERK